MPKVRERPVAGLSPSSVTWLGEASDSCRYSNADYQSTIALPETAT